MNKTLIAETLTRRMTGLVFQGIRPVGGSLEPDTFQAILKIVGEHEYINLDVVQSVVYDVFFEKLKHRIKADSAVSSKLTPIQIQSIAKKVADELSTLPHTYNVLLPLSSSREPLVRSVVTKNVEILTIEGEEREKYTPTPRPTTKPLSGLERLIGSIRVSARIPDKQNVVRINLSGYISGYGLLETKKFDPFFYYKVIVAYLVVCGVLKKQPIKYLTYSNGGYQAREYRYFIHGGDNSYIRTIDETFDDDVVREGYIIENAGDGIYHLMNAIEDLSILMMDPVKTEASLVEHRRKLLQALFWYYESLKAPETHQKAICLCSSMDSIFDIKSQKPSPEGKYSTPIKCEMIAQAVTARLDNEDFIKGQLTEVYKYRDSVIHGKEPIDSTQKYGAAGIPQELIVKFAQRHVGLFLEERVKRFNLAKKK